MQAQLYKSCVMLAVALYAYPDVDTASVFHLTSELVHDFDGIMLTFHFITTWQDFICNLYYNILLSWTLLENSNHEAKERWKQDTMIK